MGDFVEILIDGPEALRRAQEFIGKAARAYWARKQPIRVVISSEDQTNTAAQKRYLRGPVLSAIAAQARWDGEQFPPDFWMEYYRRRFLLRDEFQTPDGEILYRFWSTSDRAFTARMMSEFIEKVQAEAVMDWGVIFDV